MLNYGLQNAISRPLAACCFFISILVTILLPSEGLSQVSSADAPAPGDIIFTQVGSTDPDRFEFITLKRLNLFGLKLTDNGILSNGKLDIGEGTISLNVEKYAALQDVPGGTFIRFEKGNGTDDMDFSDKIITIYWYGAILLSIEGDQVIAYTGSSESPTYIAGVNFGNDGWITSGTLASSNTSYAPNTASDIHLGKLENYIFTGEVNSDASTTRNYIKDLSHWEGSSTNYAFTLKEIGNDLLPVELIYFAGKYLEKKILLQWTTATEVNNFGWDIERKYEKHNWQKIGFIHGKGNSNSTIEYSFSDNSILAGKLFSYRLKQIDNDGETIQYSEAIEVSIPEVNRFHLKQNYPNPFNNSTVISYSIAEESMVSLKLYNILGEEIASFINTKQQPGNYDFKLNLSAIDNYGALQSGIYLYKLQAGSLCMVRKFILLK